MKNSNRLLIRRSSLYLVWLLAVPLYADTLEIIDELLVNGDPVNETSGVIGLNIPPAGQPVIGSGLEIREGVILLKSDESGGPRITFQDDKLAPPNYGGSFYWNYFRSQNRLQMVASDAPTDVMNVFESGRVTFAGTVQGTDRVSMVKQTSDGGLLGLDALTGLNPNIKFYEAGVLRANLQIDNSASTHALVFKLPALPGGSVLPRMSVYPNGDVKIGVGLPASKLDVDGPIRADDPVNADHVVTKGWLESGNFTLVPQGDIPMYDPNN